MFGYVRPFKPDLLMKEYTYYRAVYCGLCRQIGRSYGQVARLTLGYDLTMLALLLLALSERQAGIEQHACLLNPVRKKPVVAEHEILLFSAAVSVILSWHKAGDDIRDGQAWRGRTARTGLWQAYRRALRQHPFLDQLIRQHLAELHQMEKGEADLAAAGVFGRMLAAIFAEAAVRTLKWSGSDDLRQVKALEQLGYDLGCWIYLLDAIDDWEDDWNNNRWNPFGRIGWPAVKEIGLDQLQHYEAALDRTAALLPYQQHSGLIANIILKGLATVREQVFSGQKPGRV